MKIKNSVTIRVKKENLRNPRNLREEKKYVTIRVKKENLREEKKYVIICVKRRNSWGNEDWLPER